MDAWHHAARSLGPDLGGGRSFDLDFHTIPFHGDDALLERHYVSKRSRRQKGILAFLARDADARLFAWANASLRKHGQNDEILRFAAAWRERTGELPAELVFDSRLTTYANLAQLHQLGIASLTLRRRTPKMVAELLSAPAADWRKVTLSNIGRIYRTPRILERKVRLKDYCCISLCFDKILQIIPMQGRGIFWINSLLQERVTVASLTETYGSTGPLPGLNSLLQ